MGLEYTLSREELLGHADQALYKAETVEAIKQATDAQLAEIADQVADEIVDGVEEIYALDHAVGDVLFPGQFEAAGNYFFLFEA